MGKFEISRGELGEMVWGVKGEAGGSRTSPYGGDDGSTRASNR